jgi:UDP-N-acetylmuramate--alanine ligase
MNFDDTKTVHFVGIGGIGMSGLAEVLAKSGRTVSGCDLKRSVVTDLLESRGVRVLFGHDPAHLVGAGLVVVTAAVRGENDEIDAARAAGIPVVRRSELLGEIASRKRAIGVAGTHGKTTTSAMIATILEEAGLDPTVLVGGMIRNYGTNAKAGAGEYLVVEADEYDRTFHQLHPEIAVVTNIEADHLEYYGSLEAIVEAFRVYVHGIRPGGVFIACHDDPAVVRLLDAMSGQCRVVRYGLSPGADLTATRISFHDRGSSFEVPGSGFFKLFVPGEHNIRNALAAIAVGLQLGIETTVIGAALAKYLGVDRRFQILGDYAGAIIVDDYAHHPTEIRATLAAARKGFPDRRVVAVFQPHLYSRTRDFAGDFASALRTADVAIVAPIYAAREKPVAGISAKMIADAAPGFVEFLDRSNNEIYNEMRRRLQPHDILITMGAGDVNEIAEMLVRSAVDIGGMV